jgi:hypothetical protein|tara:strand:+ start:2386 stop:2565 length:180 start_codon:yes stop_codon:yes gene_type:complete
MMMTAVFVKSDVDVDVAALSCAHTMAKDRRNSRETIQKRKPHNFKKKSTEKRINEQAAA